LAVWLPACERQESPVQNDADIVIVGAGLAGLSAAIDAASSGADVLVIDMNSVFGGHGIQSGGVAVVGSPMQAELGFVDTPDKAYRDWMEWTVDGHPEWTRFYADNSRELIYDWVTGLGVRFDRIIPSHGNSEPRFHMTYRRGLNLLRPLYLESLRYSNITFRWNVVAQHLTMQDGRIVGVQARDLRLDEPMQLHAAAVILSTGGFQSNIAMVRENWYDNFRVPEKIYSMSGQYSRGTGHRMAEEAGAALVNMDRQYNGYAALPNVLGLEDERGFVGGNSRTIWVNGEGRRFVTEGGIDRYVFPVVMQQEPPGYWHIFDDDDKDGFRINSPHFVSAEAVDGEKIQRLLIDNPSVTTKADTIEELAELIGLPRDTLAETVREFNAGVIAGDSMDVNGMMPENPPPYFRIDTAPYYAMRAYPMANKSAGGVSVDLGTRALDGAGQPVSGLYAAGELNGSAGINGLNGLDGMFTGPAILTGRVAGRTAVADLKAAGNWTEKSFTRDENMSADNNWPALPDLDASDLEPMLTVSRDGYWHFERSHHLVLERNYACVQCHSELVPFAPLTERVQYLAQTETCNACHLAPAGTLDPTSHQASEDRPD
jgi:succinate dehydrogenase/fumarate reductase flavoprotein subunit